MPTEIHQFIIHFMLNLLEAFARDHAPGKVSFSGLRMRLKGKGKQARFRQPDVLYLKEAHFQRRHGDFWDGADLVMEVVSGDAKDRERDYVTKVKEYAAAGIPEYWIIDPDEALVCVLTLKGRAYKVHGDFRAGMEASSVLLPGFKVAENAILAAAEGN